MAAVMNVADTGNAIIDALTAQRVWATTSLQYYIGDNTTLALDANFEASYHSFWKGAPDAVFQFSSQMGRSYASLNAVSGLDITQTFDTNEADMVLVSTTKNPKSGIYGFHDFPAWTEFGVGNYRNLGAFNANKPMTADAERGGGSTGDLVIIHELGHSMGMNHSHNNRNGNPLPAIGAMDSNRYTVMSYNQEANNDHYGNPVGYMALDIAVLQSLYGAADYAMGDSSYALTYRKTADLDLTEGATVIGRAWYSIWDSGGEDAVSFSGAGTHAVVINLNAATIDTSDTGDAFGRVIAAIRATAYFDTLTKSARADMVRADHVAGGSFSYVVGQVGGYSIAQGAEIENATGGLGNDFLIGNALDNMLTGGGGKDTLLGGDGNDTLDGGLGNDILVGGLGADTFVYSGGNDVIKDFNEAEGDTLVGDWPVG